jgi:hypothetical protein
VWGSQGGKKPPGVRMESVFTAHHNNQDADNTQ